MRPMKSITIAILLLETFAIVIALLLGAKDGKVLKHFVEGGFITWWSFYQLLILAGLSWQAFTLRYGRFKPRIWTSSEILWAVIAAGFVFLAFDEIAEIHEQTDKLVHRFAGIIETPLSDRLDDAIVAFYGLIGIAFLYYYRDEWRSYPSIFPFFIGGFVLLFVMVGLDALNNEKIFVLMVTSSESAAETLRTWLSVLEESFKIFAEGLFIGGFYHLSALLRERQAIQSHSDLLAGGILTLLSIVAFGNAFQYVNIVLHITVVILVYGVALRIGLSWSGALVAAALFAVHPLHTDAVARAAGRGELLMALGVLLSLVLYIRGGAPERLELRYAVASSISFFIALLFRGRAVALPALLVLYDLYGWKDKIKKTAVGRALLRYTGYLLVLVCTLAIRGLMFGEPPFLKTQGIAFVDNPLAHLEGLTRLLTALKAAGKYLWLFAWPYDLAADYSYNTIRPAVSLWEPEILAIVAAWGCLWYLAFWSYFKGSRQAFFAVGFTCLTFLPASNLLMPIETLMAERLFYLPSVGLCLLVGTGWDGLAGWAASRGTTLRATRIALCGLTAILLLLSVRAIRRNQDWKSDYALARSTVETTPRNAKARYMFGSALLARQKSAEALREFAEALQIYPDYLEDPLFVEQWGALLIQTGRVDEAIRISNEALSRTPELPGLYHNLGIAYQKKGLWREAELAHRREFSLLEKAQDAQPLAVADSLDNLAKVYAVQGKHAQSEQYLRRGLSILQEAYGFEHVSTAELIGHMGLLHFFQGNYAKAESHFRQALEIVEKNAGYQSPLMILHLERYASLLRKTDRHADALRVEERARALRSRHRLLQ